MGRKFFGKINNDAIYFEECDCDERCKNYPYYSPDGSYSYYCSKCDKGYFIKNLNYKEEINKVNNKFFHILKENENKINKEQEKQNKENEDLKKIKMLDFKIYLNNIRVEIEDLIRKNFNELGFKYTEELNEINNDIESIKNDLTSAKNKIIDLL